MDFDGGRGMMLGPHPKEAHVNPTPEQQEAVDLFGNGLGLAIEAGAGTGKTTTLKLLGASTSRRGAYMAFNRSIVDEAKRKMPDNVGARTAHSYAWAVGKNYQHRLDAPRQRSMDIARALGIGHITCRYGSETKVLQPGTLAGYVMKAIGRYCNSADELPGPQHFEYIHGIDPSEGGKRGWSNNEAVRRELEIPLRKAWLDVTNPDGTLRFSHDVYLKLFQLERRQIAADFLLVDEAQDLSPVMLAIAEAQDDTQLVFVGDSQQQIYGWRGAVNALEKVPADSRTFLTRSFRFGPAIAEVANAVLSVIGAPIRLTGHDPIDSTVGPVAQPAAILTRTNAEAVTRALASLENGGQPHLIGGGAEVVRFARAAKDLKAGNGTVHPELVCFDSWGQVQEYIAQDPQGDELRLLVELIDEHGPDKIISAMEVMPPEREASVVISTAHKAKGREWDSVRLAEDFGDEDLEGTEEWRLLYVAATRAQKALDLRACTPLRALLEDESRAVSLADVEGDRELPLEMAP